MEKSSPVFSQRLAQRRGDYGFDAPYVPAIFLLIGLVMLGIGLLSLLLWQSLIFGIIDLLFGVYMLLSGASYIYTTRRGKFQVWAELLSSLNLRGDEQVLDLGTGRGAVLLMAAALLPKGKGTGVWVAGGFSGHGMPFGMRLGQLMCEAVTSGVAPDTLAYLRLHRPTLIQAWAGNASWS